MNLPVLPSKNKGALFTDLHRGTPHKPPQKGFKKLSHKNVIKQKNSPPPAPPDFLTIRSTPLKRN